MPLTVEQANSTNTVADGKSDDKNGGISKMISMHEANHKHFELTIPRLAHLLAKCATRAVVSSRSTRLTNPHKVTFGAARTPHVT